jgi:hypothetical protein
MGKSRAERRLAEQKAKQKGEQGRAWGIFGAVALALVPWVVPRLPAALISALGVIWLASWPMARNGYKYRLATGWTFCVMIAHAVPLIVLGYFVWPRITISPHRIVFEGYPGETMNFSVRNGRADDVYDVQVPFLIGYNKHFEDKLSARVMPNGEPHSGFNDVFNYCFGHKGDGVVSHVQPNEREVLIVHIPHLAPFASGIFSVSYAGGEKLAANSEQPSFVSEPTSYAYNFGTFGVRGDYRICKFENNPAGDTGK